jgi:hypothetical protein
MTLKESLDTYLFSNDAVRGFAFLVVIFTMCWLAIDGKPVPEELKAIAYVIVGFYFGANSANLVRRKDVEWPTSPTNH